MTSPKRTTRAQDAAYLARRLEDAARGWKVGDACRSFRGLGTTRVAAVAGSILKLEDGTSGHVSRMMRPEGCS